MCERRESNGASGTSVELFVGAINEIPLNMLIDLLKAAAGIEGDRIPVGGDGIVKSP